MPDIGNRASISDGFPSFVRSGGGEIAFDPRTLFVMPANPQQRSIPLRYARSELPTLANGGTGGFSHQHLSDNSAVIHLRSCAIFTTENPQRTGNHAE